MAPPSSPVQRPGRLAHRGGRAALAGPSESAVRTRAPQCVSVCVRAHARALPHLGSWGRAGVLRDERGKRSPRSGVPDPPDCALTLPTQPAAFAWEAVARSLGSFPLQDQARK